MCPFALSKFKKLDILVLSSPRSISIGLCLKNFWWLDLLWISNTLYHKWFAKPIYIPVMLRAQLDWRKGYAKLRVASSASTNLYWLTMSRELIKRRRARGGSTMPSKDLHLYRFRNSESRWWGEFTSDWLEIFSKVAKLNDKCMPLHTRPIF